MVEQVKDVFEVDVNQEVKQVIDVEAPNEDDVRTEISNYIVTKQLADHFGTLFDAIESELEETGVWLSGFYGSGKSYFAKIFGYLLKNPTIGGTSVHERFSHRLEGIDKKEWLRQSLGMVRNKDFTVVMLDLTQHGDMSMGLPWTVFENLLTELGYLNNKYGLVEFDLFLDDKYERFTEAVKRETGESWEEQKRSLKNYSAMRQGLESEFSDSFGNNVDQLYRDIEEKMNNFGASDLKRELGRYFDKFPDRQIFFIVDEVSQAVTDGLIELSNLQGVQESLSAVGTSKVWLMATAQERLTDVLSRDNISKNELSKITDRFKTTLHISGEEVDKVVKERLLKKSDEGREALSSFYDEHSGEISELTNLQNCELPSTTTDNKEDFIEHYPFHPYQMKLLKDFLYKVHQQVTGSETPRGMIIVLHRVLDKSKGKLSVQDLYKFATAYQLAEQGEKFPNTAIKQRFNEAESVVDHGGKINGRHLMEATYFLTETGRVTPMVQDIAKACIAEAGRYYEVKNDYSKAIDALQEGNLLIKKEGYSIATELEEQLISEMKQEDVGTENRKRVLTEQVNETGIFSGFRSVELDEQSYKVKAVDSSGNLMAGKPGAELSLKIINLYEIGSMDYQDAIEDVKYQEEDNKNSLAVIPKTRDFRNIDSLIQKIYRYQIIEQRYGNDSDKEKRRIANDMQDDRRNKEEVLRQKLKKAYMNGVLVRDFEEYELDENNFSLIKDQMRELAKNLYTKRLSCHLDENIAPKILKEDNPENLNNYLDADEFQFFDSGGNFTGEGLPTVDEIRHKASDVSVDGKTLEEDFGKPPYGWELGDIVVTLAVLLRAGRLKVKYQGEEILDYNNRNVIQVFENSRKFRKAQFKVIDVSPPPSKKRDLVDAIKEINGGKYSDSNLDHNSAAFHVVKQISQVAGGYLNEAKALERSLGDFADEIPEISSITNQLKAYHNRTVNENNYTQIADEFLEDSDEIAKQVDLIWDIQNFQQTNLEHLRKYRSFVEDLQNQISNVGDASLEAELRNVIDGFKRQNKDPVDNFPQLQELFQKAKDHYHQAMSQSHEAMAKGYRDLVEGLEDVLAEARNAGEEENSELIEEITDQLDDLKEYICDNLSITNSVKCDNCSNDLKTAVLATKNLSNLEDKLFDYRDRIETPTETTDEEEEHKTHSVNLPRTKMSVSEYRKFLNEQLEISKGLDPRDKIEIDFEK